MKFVKTSRFGAVYFGGGFLISNTNILTLGSEARINLKSQTNILTLGSEARINLKSHRAPGT